MNKFWCFAAAAVAVFGMSKAHAYGGSSKFHLGLSGLKYDTKVSGDTWNGKEERLHTDIKLGYVSDSGIYFGAVQSNYSESNSTSSPNRSSMGVTLGYRNDGWLFDATYFLSSTYTNGSVKFEDGSGYGIEFGYNFQMSSSFYLGLELATKSLSYKKVNSVAANNTFTELMPLFNLGFYF